MSVTEDDVRRAVQAEAAGHTPDRTAMLNRVTRTGMRHEAARTRPAGRLLIAGAAATVTAVLGGGGIAQWSLAGDGDYQPMPAPALSPVTPSAGASSAAATRTGAAAPSSPQAGESTAPPAGESAAPPAGEYTAPPAGGSAAPPAGGSPAPPAGGSAVPEPLRADGSVDPGGDTQGSSVVTIRSTGRLDALTVTIRLARTPDLASRGGSRQVPGASVATSVAEAADALTYRFVLSAADTVDAGTYTFSARYLHASGGRDAGGDSWTIAATTATGEELTVAGDFG